MCHGETLSVMNLCCGLARDFQCAIHSSLVIVKIFIGYPNQNFGTVATFPSEGYCHSLLVWQRVQTSRNICYTHHRYRKYCHILCSAQPACYITHTKTS